MVAENIPSEVYQGQFGNFTITNGDRLGVVAYRGLLLVASTCFATAVMLAIMVPHIADVLDMLTILYWLFSLALGGSLLLIHIYLVPLHRTLQLFWIIGTVSAVVFSLHDAQPLLLTIYDTPLSIIGIGFTFAALTGIFFKEAFCFARLETKGLTFIVPTVLLGHLFGVLPLSVEKGMLATWAGLMLVFALRKVFQEIPADIGDKSVFAYLKQQKAIAQ